MVNQTVPYRHAQRLISIQMILDFVKLTLVITVVGLFSCYVELSSIKLSYYHMEMNLVQSWVFVCLFV